VEDNLKVVLTADQLCRRCWCFGHDDTRIYAPFLRFGDGGRLIGYRHANESGWMITEGRLAFLDEAGRPTTVFDHSTVGADGRIRLEGRHRDSSIIHFLREIDPEHGPATGASYDFQAATEEGFAVSKKFGNHDHYVIREFGGILA
jgi:hypothetical protein